MLASDAFEYEVKHHLSFSNQTLVEVRNKIRSSSLYFLENQKSKQFHLISLMDTHSKSLINKEFQLLLNQTKQLIRVSPGKIREELLKLDQKEMQLKLVDPLNVLKRGYAIVTNEKGVLSAKNQAKSGDNLKIVTEAQELKTKVQ